MAGKTLLSIKDLNLKSRDEGFQFFGKPDFLLRV